MCERPTDPAGTIETMSTKVGLVLLVLGGMHFFNLYVFSKMRRKALPGATRSRRCPRAVSNPGALLELCRIAIIGRWDPEIREPPARCPQGGLPDGKVLRPV